MSSDNGHSLERLELASLPPGDPHRQQLAERLRTEVTPEERQAWEREFALTDVLRERLAQVDVPADLERRLLAIPEAPAPVAALAPARIAPASILRRRVDWRIAAAVIILAGVGAAYFFIFRQPAKPSPLDQALASQLAAWAVEHHAAPVNIASADEAAVQKSLTAHAPDFPVLILRPSEGTLQGGGAVTFGTTPAVFTRWQSGGHTYTLFEFNGRRLGVPPLFYSLVQVPRELWREDKHFQVFLFPGTKGKCCWALVMESESAPNVFSAYGAAY